MTTKTELLDAEDRGWRALQERFHRISEWEKPGVAGDWCAKDVLAHVACWHAEVAGWLERWRSHEEKPGEIDFQALNDRFYERCRDMTLHDVQAMSSAARHRMREEIARMDGEPRKGWVRAIETCAHEHYAEHIPDLDAYLASGS